MRHRYSGDLFVFDVNRDGMLADLVNIMLRGSVDFISQQLLPVVMLVLRKRGTNKSNSTDHGKGGEKTAANHHGCSWVECSKLCGSAWCFCGDRAHDSRGRGRHVRPWCEYLLI